MAAPPFSPRRMRREESALEARLRALEDHAARQGGTSDLAAPGPSGAQRIIGPTQGGGQPTAGPAVRYPSDILHLGDTALTRDGEDVSPNYLQVGSGVVQINSDLQLGFGTSTSLFDVSADAILPTSYAHIDLSLFVPRWIGGFRTFSAFSAAAMSFDLEIFSLPAGGIVHAVALKHNQAWAGPGIASCTISVGIAANFVKWAPAFSVFGAPSGTNFQFSELPSMENQGAVTSVRVQAVSTGANLSALTQGTISIAILYSVFLL